jgi:phosphoheptose isomerase
MEIALNGRSTAEQRVFTELLKDSNVICNTAFCPAGKIVTVVEHIIVALEHGFKVMTCGTRGSAADTQHFVAELGGRFRSQRPGWSVTTLTVEPSVLI